MQQVIEKLKEIFEPVVEIIGAPFYTLKKKQKEWFAKEDEYTPFAQFFLGFGFGVYTIATICVTPIFWAIILIGSIIYGGVSVCKWLFELVYIDLEDVGEKLKKILNGIIYKKV